MKISEIIKKLEEYHPPLSEREREHTCDVYKCGDPDRECTGIAVTCYASYNVVKTAAERGINLIICHEPAFYNHADKTDWLADNSVYAEKKRIIDEYGIVIWRDHDHIHAGPMSSGREYPDMIFRGIMMTLGWEKYVLDDPKKPLLYGIPETTVRELTKELTEKLNLNGARIIGDADAKVSKVFLCEHIRGNDGPFGSDSDKIARIEKEGFDVIIPLETVDWTILEYVTDSAQQGKGRAVISMGHFNFEEPGMQYMARWLPEIIGGGVKVEYIQSGDIYSYISR